VNPLKLISIKIYATIKPCQSIGASGQRNPVRFSDIDGCAHRAGFSSSLESEEMSYYTKLSGIIIPGFASTKLRAWSVLDCPYSPFDFNPLDAVRLDSTKVSSRTLYFCIYVFQYIIRSCFIFIKLLFSYGCNQAISGF
jgi:hypothetical protein